MEQPKPHGNGYSTPEREYRRFMTAILFLMIMLALFELTNGALNIVLLVNDSKVAEERSKTTRQIVISVGSCLIEGARTDEELEKCVSRKIDKEGREDFNGD